MPVTIPKKSSASIACASEMINDVKDVFLPALGSSARSVSSKGALTDTALPLIMSFSFSGLISEITYV